MWFGVIHFKHCSVYSRPRSLFLVYYVTNSWNIHWHIKYVPWCSEAKFAIYSDIQGFLQKSWSATCEKYVWKSFSHTFKIYFKIVQFLGTDNLLNVGKVSVAWRNVLKAVVRTYCRDCKLCNDQDVLYPEISLLPIKQ